MKILLVHAAYDPAAPSGENQVVHSDLQMLRDVQGLHVDLAELSASDYSNPISLVATAVGAVRAKIDIRRYDLVHAHNLLPSVGPKLLATAQASGLVTIRTFHNYRASCLNGMHFRNGSSCELCVHGGSFTPGVLRGCYRNSRSQSLVIAAGTAQVRSTDQKLDAAIALTPYMKEYLDTHRVAGGNVVVRPTRAAVTTKVAAFNERIYDFAFVGRLDEAKGVRLFVEAMSTGAWSTVIAGDGPMKPYVVEAANPHMKYVGALTEAEVIGLLRRVKYLVVPSRWLEGYPAVVARALGQGTPVVLAQNKNLASIARAAGQVMFAGSVEDLRHEATALLDEDKWRSLSQAAHTYATQNLDISVAAESLVDLYATVLRDKR